MIDTSVLRKKILAKAMSGQLSTHLEEDDSVEYLLEKVALAKLATQKSGKSRKTKQLPPIETEETPFEVPSRWKVIRLGEIAWFGGGHTPSTSDADNYCENGILWVTSKDMKRDWIDSTQITLTEKGAAGLTIYPAGTLLMVTRSGILRRILPVAMLAKEAAVNQDQKAIIPFELAMSEWLLFYLKACDEFIRKRFSKTGATVESIVFERVKELPVSIPPIAEQQRIVNTIKELFAQLDAIDEARYQYLADSQILRDKIIDSGIRGNLTANWRVMQCIADDNWAEREIGESFDVVGGIQKKPDRAPKNNPVPYVTVANVFRNRIDLADLRYFELFDGELERLQLKEKDILVVEGNGSGGEIGRCAMWENQIPVCVHQNHIIRLRCTDDQVLPEYVLLFLNSPTGKAVVRERAKTTTGLYNLSAGKIRSIPVPLPSLEEQKRIVERVGELLQALPA